MLEARDRVTQILSENKDILTAVAKELLDKETIMLEDLDRIIEANRTNTTQFIDGEPQVSEGDTA